MELRDFLERLLSELPEKTVVEVSDQFLYKFYPGLKTWRDQGKWWFGCDTKQPEQVLGIWNGLVVERISVGKLSVRTYSNKRRVKVYASDRS